MPTNSLAMTSAVATDFVWTAVKATINKFREHPGYFFTESDITSYLYKRLYSSKFAVKAHGRTIYCVHREYPTNFRYKRDSIEVKQSLTDPVGKRGHFDLVVLSPEFVLNSAQFVDVVNKNIKGLQEKNLDGSEEHLLFAIELKYVISNHKEWSNQIAIDNEKLADSLTHNVTHAVNLVFCNNPGSAQKLVSSIHAASPGVCAILTESTFNEGNIKTTPKPIVSESYQGSGKAKLRW